jgi:DNA-directed RNA polymerase subunit omega
MARVTIEDCIEKVPNRFQLVQMAAIRAKQLKKGANPVLPSEQNKAVVVALREIAAGLVSPDLSSPGGSEEELITNSLLDEEVVEPEPIEEATDPEADSAAE